MRKAMAIVEVFLAEGVIVIMISTIIDFNQINHNILSDLFFSKNFFSINKVKELSTFFKGYKCLKCCKLRNE
jgi:hypothetical protein